MSGLDVGISQSLPRTKKFHCSPALLLFGLVLSPALGQTQNSPEQAIEKPDHEQKITSNVDEVSLDLLVHDKKRKLVDDLKPGDFVVTDNGTTVKLNDFRFVKGDTARGHMVTLVFDRFTGPTAKSARTAAQKILDVLPANGYSMAVLDFAGRMRLLQRYTQDRKLIAQAIETATESQATALESTHSLAVSIVTDKAEPARAAKVAEAEKEAISIARTGVDATGAHVDPAERAKVQILVTALQDAQQIASDQHASRSLSGLLALVKAQQKAGERKAIIYFTQNRQMDSAQKEMVKSISAAATKSAVSFYTVDFDALNETGQYQLDNAMANGPAPFNPGPKSVPGSGGMATYTPIHQQTPDGFGNTPGGHNWTTNDTIGVMTDFHRRSNDYEMFAHRDSPMSQLASDTGGEYIDAQNSLKKPLQQMVEDLTTYYEASYVPPISEYDGAFHSIEIKPLREGLRIQSKTGYYAVPPGADARARPFEAPVMKLFTEQDARTDVKFHAAVLHFGEMSDGNTSTVAVEVPVAAIETKKDVHTNLFSAHISIVAQIKDKNGAVIEHFAEDISRRGALETIDRDKSATINLQRHFPATPGQYTLEVAVLDRFNDKAGVQRLNFEIPPQQTTPSLSDIVLVRKVDAFKDDDDPQEPMRFEKGKITPNLSGDVPQDAKDVSLFFVLHPDPKSKDPVTLEMIASRNGRPGRRMPVPLHLDNTQAAAPYMASFKAGMAPGDYEVKAMMNQGGKTSIQQISFTIEGDQHASNGSASMNVAPGGHGDDSAGAEAAVAMAPPSGSLAITAITNPVPPPAPEEIKQLIADARDRALHYVESLPNFMCLEVTTRSVDPTGAGKWKLRDTISELLTYRDKKESRTMLQVNGKSETANREGMAGTFSSGELGGVLKAVFLDSAKADFNWKETDSLGSGTVQVFDYRVAQPNSVFSVVGRNDKQIMVGFHGQIFIDTATRNVRRITLIADLPRDFPTHYTSIAVDYEYVAINAHDYLMPIGAELRLQQGRHEAVLNTIEFRNYRRFGSNMRIVTDATPVERQ